jgi:hypothetical protein
VGFSRARSGNAAEAPVLRQGIKGGNVHATALAESFRTFSVTTRHPSAAAVVRGQVNASVGAPAKAGVEAANPSTLIDNNKPNMGF